MFKIGGWPQWTLFEVRERAQEIRRKVEAGEDPVPPRIVVPTVTEAFEDFTRSLEIKGRRRGTLKDYRCQYRVWLEERFGNRPVDKVTRADLAQLADEITAKGAKTRANRVLATVSSMYGWLNRDRDYQGSNPARGLERRHEEPREVFLTPEQIDALRLALAAYAARQDGRSRCNASVADCLLFCLATGCRSGEAKAATWSMFDEGLGTWSKPAATTKSRRLHVVPLGNLARDILVHRLRLRRDGEAVVFPNKTGGHLTNVRHAWAEISKAAGIEGCRVHDLRHSFASIGLQAGLTLPMLGKLLGHTRTETTARYSHISQPDLRAAAGAVNALIDRAK
jgi:integrase